ncbi:MAG: polysaccharide deacetylase family protein [Verrucomicrobiota bacterium]
MSARALLPPLCRRMVLMPALALLTALSVAGADKAGPTKISNPPPLEKAGLVLTFDDRNFDDWLAALPLFDQYGVKATFFISGPIDEKALAACRQLIAHGHAIGSHSVHHLKALDYVREHSIEDYLRQEIQPQLDAWHAAGIPITAFAFPSSSSDAATERALLKVFRHLRIGGPMAPGDRLSDRDPFFTLLAQVPTRGALPSKGIDYAPTREDRTFEQFDAALARAATRGEILTLYAHGIRNMGGKGHFITPQALEHLFLKARELKLMFYTFDQLPSSASPDE